MKRIVLTAVAITLFSSTAFSAGDPATYFSKHRYEEAGTVLRDAVRSNPSSASTQFLLGMNCLKISELYKDLYRHSLVLNIDYLEKLYKATGSDRSRYAALFYGETLLETGDLKKAETSLNRYLGEKQIKGKDKEIGRVDLGYMHFLKGDNKKASDTWSKVDTSDQEVLAKLAAAYGRAGFKKNDPAGMGRKALEQAKKQGGKLPVRMVGNILAVYAAEGMIDEAFDLLKMSDLKEFAYEEVPAKNKVIRFYDPSLLKNLSVLYEKAAEKAFMKAANDPKLADGANYYLGEVYVLSGEVEQSEKVTSSFIASSKSEKLKKKAEALHAANIYIKGDKADGLKRWNSIAKGSSGDAEIVSEVLIACGRTGADCGAIAVSASADVEKIEGKRAVMLNHAIGRYYLQRSDYGKALTYLEAGRDKGFKNKIEQNDPLLLANLAVVYYRSKQFSEALEIYFEMSGQFPAIRQLQAALQGIYSVEQKSAGDVKIF